MRAMIGVLLLACCAMVSAQTIINPDANNTFHVTGSTGTASWTIGGQNNPTLNMTVGTTYYISIEFNTATGQPPHPFGLNGVNNNGAGATTVAANGLVNNASSCGTLSEGFTYSGTGPFCVLAFTPNITTPQLYYHCAFHSNMFGQILVNGVTASTGGSTGSTGSTGGSSGGNGTTITGTSSTPSPTASTGPQNNGTTSPPTNKNSAVALVPGIAALAAIVAGLFAQ